MNTKILLHPVGVRFNVREGTSDEMVIKECIDANAYGLTKNVGKVIVDIGANIGAFTVYAAHLCPKARIFAFEPEPNNFAVLKSNLAINGMEAQVAACPMAVSDHRGRELITQQCGNSRIATTGIDHTDATRVECQTITLDDVLTMHDIPVCDFLKIDAEWSEYQILNVPDETLRRLKRIVMETHQVPEPKWNELINRLARTHALVISAGYMVCKVK